MPQFQMKKGTMILLGILFSLVLVTALFFNMSYLKTKQQSRQFERNYEHKSLQLIRSFEFQGNVPEIKYFDHKLYLSEFRKGRILALDTLGNILTVFPKTPDKQGTPKIYYFDVNQQGIYMVDYDKKNFRY